MSGGMRGRDVDINARGARRVQDGARGEDRLQSEGRPRPGSPAQHADGEFHHHHAHAPGSRHPLGRHLLVVERLSVSFRMYDPAMPYMRAERIESRVLHDVSLSVHTGEILAVVGASGSGKTLLADALLGLYEPNARVTGTIWFDGEQQDAAHLVQLRGHGISLVPQGVTHLNPLMRVGDQVIGPCGLGSAGRARRRERTARMYELFHAHGLARDVARMFPHELSGGMARRVLLICALMDAPRVIVADEPTPGLDVERAVQALADFRSFADAGGGVLLITHDLELALHVADRVAVFHEGTIVEETAAASFADPGLLKHPFSRALWHAMPEHDFDSVAWEEAFGSSSCSARGDGDTSRRTGAKVSASHTGVCALGKEGER